MPHKTEHEDRGKEKKIHLWPHEYMRMRTKGEGWIYEDRPLATFSSRPSPALESLEGPAAESGEFNWDIYRN